MRNYYYMATNPEIHRENLHILAQESGGVRKLAERLGKSDSQVSQWLNASLNSGTGKPRGMRPDTARYIEEQCDKPRGWMDVRHNAFLEISSIDKPSEGGDIEIRQYHEVGGAMGNGVILRDQPGEIHSWRVTPDWIAQNVRSHTGAANLCIVTGFGDSMQPLYNPGDPLLVDIGVKNAEYDGIYFFRIGNEGFIKRLQRIPGVGLMAISDNKLYEKWVITPNMDFEVFAKVVKVWCGSDR